MVIVTFKDGKATVSVDLDARSIVDSRSALLGAQRLIDAAIVAGAKSDAEVQAEVAAEVATRIAARPDVTGLAEHVAAVVAAQKAEGVKNDSETVGSGSAGDLGVPAGG